MGDIRGIVGLRDDGETPCGHVLDLLRARSNQIDRTIRDLRRLQRELERLVERAAAPRPEGLRPHRVCHLIGPEADRQAATSG